jgi:hypothetical protein
MFPLTPPVSAFDIPADDATNTYHSKITSKSKYIPREPDLPLTGIKITEEVRINVEKKWRFDFTVAAHDFFTIK